MKIVLAACNASYVHTNLAVRCIAAELTERGFETEIVERSIKDRTGEFLHALYRADGDIYGFSVYIWNRELLCSVAADLHCLKPDARIVFGGPEISYETDDFFTSHPYVDHIIAGEGELAFPAYAAAPPPRHTILCGTPFDRFTEAGILYDRFPPGEHSGGILYYESARGCPFSCAYCLSATENGIRAKSASRTIEELRRFEHIPGAKIIKFIDRTFNFDRRRADTIWRALASDGYTKTYHFEICADLLDEENFRTLADMPPGRIQLECGIQSTNPETLSSIERSADPQKILSALARIRSFGNIHVHADLIAGLPRENYQRFARSFDESYPCCDLLQLGFLKLLPGTPLRTACLALGYRFSPTPPYEVLTSDVLSYEELCRLHRIDDVLDRFSGSAHFTHTLTFVMKHEASPFKFFEALADALDSPRSLSQREAFSRFRRFIHSRLLPTDTQIADEKLTIDWYLHETSSPPDGLFLPPAPNADELCRAYCTAHPEVPRNTVIAVMPLTSERPLLLDRRNHRIL